MDIMERMQVQKAEKDLTSLQFDYKRVPSKYIAKKDVIATEVSTNNKKPNNMAASDSALLSFNINT
jgi:hypothetical protein